MLRIINDDGKNGASIPFGTMPTPDKIVLSTKTWEICATDESDDLSLREILFAKVSLRSGQFILKNIAPRLIDAPRICDSPVEDSIVLPFGAIFTIPGLSLCLECDETKHGQELIDPVSAAPKRKSNKTLPRVTKKTLAKRQKIQVDESDGPRRCCCCGVQNVNRWRFHFGEVYCNSCEYREFYTNSSQARFQQMKNGIPSLDLSIGKVVSYHRGKGEQRAIVVENMLVLRDSDGFFTAPANEIVAWSNGWQLDSQVTLRTGKIGFLTAAPLLELAPIRPETKQYHNLRDRVTIKKKIWKIISSTDPVPSERVLPKFLQRRPSESVNYRIGERVEIFPIPKFPHRYATIFATSLKLVDEFGEFEVTVEDIVSKSDNWNIGSVMTTKSGKTGVLVQWPQMEVRWSKTPYPNPTKLLPKDRPVTAPFVLAKCNVGRPTSDQDLVNDVQIMFEIISETEQGNLVEQ
jgi:hypothetical protein